LGGPSDNAEAESAGAVAPGPWNFVSIQLLILQRPSCPRTTSALTVATE